MTYDLNYMVWFFAGLISCPFQFNLISLYFSFSNDDWVMRFHLGLPLRVAGAAAVLQMPYFAAVSLPMACLAASLFGLGRLQVITWLPNG